MKDVQVCDKPRGVDKKRYYSRISEWGNLIPVIGIFCKTEGHVVN